MKLPVLWTDRCQEVDQLGTLEVFWLQSRFVANVQCTHLAGYLQPDEQEAAVNMSCGICVAGLPT